MYRLAVFLLGIMIVLQTSTADADPNAELIFFTEDGTQNGTPLLPGFPLHSVWSGMGQSEDGRIFVAVSNHDEVAGNVAIFVLDPETDRFRFITDLKSVSELAGNWEDGEGQYKVHTFLQLASDGKLYFATMPASQPSERRGAHLYALDPATETIEDLSATFPATLTRKAQLVTNSGVIVDGLGIKGISLHPEFEDMLYLMSHDIGYIVRLDLRTRQFEAIGFSHRIAYVMHTDAEGDLYYLGTTPDPEKQAFLHYDAQTGETQALVSGIAKDEEVGMIAPTANPDIVLVLLAKSKEVFPLNTKTEKKLRGGTSCGKNWWRLFNMTVGPEGKYVYYVSNNNDHSRVLRAPVGGGACQRVLDVNDLLGSRNLAFGGQNIWIGDSFYTPVWTHQGGNDLALLKVTVK